MWSVPYTPEERTRSGRAVARVLDEVGRRLPGLVAGHDEDGRVGGDERDRRELTTVERRRSPEELVGFRNDRDRGERQKQCVAVGLARRHELHPDGAGRARLVHDPYRVLQGLLMAAATGRAVRSATPPAGTAPRW